jgi:peptidoglycan/LPS O-acetylase OafA/YrhL
MTYRADIDGLRAIAVLAVIFYHLKLLPGFGGGYIGVDMFFVISGYLIGGIIIDETASGIFSYIQFYARRIKRLFAAFMVVGLFTAAAGWWLLLPYDFWHTGKSLVASTVFLSNVLFYRDAGYFDPASITKPLLHTWSLGVEEQFYLCFPLLMRLSVRTGRNGVPAMLIAVGLLSLGYSQYLLAVDPAASFYLLPSRGWQLLLGAAVAQPRIRDLQVQPELRRALTFVSLVALFLPMVLYNDATPFPGIRALPCCAATAWLLWSGRHDAGLLQKTLASRLPAAVGRISYSLYLWHWPIYVYILYYEAGELSWIGRSVVFFLTFVLATLSWRLVEQPIRDTRRAPRVVFIGSFLGSVALVGIGLVIWYSGGAPGRLSGQARTIGYAATDLFQNNDRCSTDDNSILPGVYFCRIGAPSTQEQFLIWGDSHARAIREGADQAAVEHGLAGLLIFAGGCMPAFDIRKEESATGPRMDSECATQNIAVKAMLSKHNTIKKILLVGRWAYYEEGRGIGIDWQNGIRIMRATDKNGAALDQTTIVTEALSETVRWLRTAGYVVYLLEDMPEIPNFSSRRLFQFIRGGHASVEEAVAQIGTVPRKDVEDRQRLSNEALRQAAGKFGATIISTHQLFCDSDSCSAWSPFGPTYFDNNHITGSTSRRIRDIFLPAMTITPAPTAAPVDRPTEIHQEPRVSITGSRVTSQILDTVVGGADVHATIDRSPSLGITAQ